MRTDLESRRLLEKIVQTEKLLRSVAQSDLPALAQSADVAEQLPVRMALAYIGDDDTSWENACTCLRDEGFLDMVLEMEGDKFLTRRTIDRLSNLGLIDPKGLEFRSPAAHALALYLEACLLSAGHRLGMRTPTATARIATPATSLPPAWPIRIDFKDIMSRVDEAARWGKTALLVCNGHAYEADTFFSYRGIVQVDSKWIMGQVSLKKSMTVSDMQGVLHRQLLDAMRTGMPLQIAMSNSAVDFKSTYCKDGVFPLSLFNTTLIRKPVEYSTVFSETEYRAQGKELVGRMKRDFFSFVTTDFDIGHAHAHLAGVLPHFDNMAIIEVDTASFKADQLAADARKLERQQAKFGQRASDNVG